MARPRLHPVLPEFPAAGSLGIMPGFAALALAAVAYTEGASPADAVGIGRLLCLDGGPLRPAIDGDDPEALAALIREAARLGRDAP